MKDINKILIIRLGAIGDVVHTSETFRSIKREYPNVIIHYLTSEVPSLLLKNDPDLDKVIVLNEVKYKNIFNMAKQLRSESYDAVINLQPSLKLKIFAQMLFPKKIVNYKKTYKLHAVENFLQTAIGIFPNIKPANQLKLFIPQETSDNVAKLLPQGSKVVAISTQAGPVRQGKKWNIHYFKELALALVNKYDVKVLIVDSNEDREKVKDFEHLHPNIMVYAGMFDILESAALSQQVDLFISSDTGPIHIASALSKPVCIGLYGAMAIARTGVWGVRHFSVKSNLPCVPCQKRFC